MNRSCDIFVTASWAVVIADLSSEVSCFHLSPEHTDYPVLFNDLHIRAELGHNEGTVLAVW
jgi:hypothetical protein